MAIPDTDERIERLLKSKNLSRPDAVETGTEPIPAPSFAQQGQADATVRFQNDAASELAAREAARLPVNHGSEGKPGQPVPDRIVMPSNEPPADTIVTVGELQICPNPIQNGFERNATKDGHASHFVFLNGERVDGASAVGVIYEALLAAQQKSKKVSK